MTGSVFFRDRLWIGFVGWIVLLASVACGSVMGTNAADTREPFVVRVDPPLVRLGETVVVYGSDFSEAENNVVFLDGFAIVETDWNVADTGLPGEAEQVSFMIPEDIELGEHRLWLLADEGVSNQLAVTIE